MCVKSSCQKLFIFFEGEKFIFLALAEELIAEWMRSVMRPEQIFRFPETRPTLFLPVGSNKCWPVVDSLPIIYGCIFTFDVCFNLKRVWLTIFWPRVLETSILFCQV